MSILTGSHKYNTSNAHVFHRYVFMLVVATCVLTWHTVSVVSVQTVLTPSEHVSLAAHDVQIWEASTAEEWYVPLGHVDTLQSEKPAWSVYVTLLFPPQLSKQQCLHAVLS